MPNAPISMTQSGMVTLASTVPAWMVCRMAARGPTALATSLAPCANDNSMAANTSGMWNSLRSDWLRFSIFADWRRIIGLTMAMDTRNMTPESSAIDSPSSDQIFFSPFMAK